MFQKLNFACLVFPPAFSYCHHLPLQFAQVTFPWVFTVMQCALLFHLMCVFFCLLHPPSSEWPGPAFILAPISFLPRLCIPGTSLPLKESKQRRKWRGAMVPCRREEGWLMIHPCYTVGCQCINGLSLTAFQPKLQRAGRSSVRLLMPCSRTRLDRCDRCPHRAWRTFSITSTQVPRYRFVKCPLGFFWRLFFFTFIECATSFDSYSHRQIKTRAADVLFPFEGKCRRENLKAFHLHPRLPLQLNFWHSVMLVAGSSDIATVHASLMSNPPW